MFQPLFKGKRTVRVVHRRVRRVISKYTEGLCQVPGGVIQVPKSKWWNCLGVPTSFVQCARKVMSLKELEVESFYWVDLFRSGGVRYGFVRTST